MRTPKIVWSLLVLGAIATAACGDSKSLNPVGPSAVVVQGPQSDTASQAKGGVPGPPQDKGKNNDGGGNGKNPQSPANPSPDGPGLKKVEIEGLIQATDLNSLTVNGQQVVVPSTCPIRHGQTRFALSDLHVNDRVHVRANRTATALEATEVIVQNPGDGEGSGDDTPTTLVSVTATDDTADENPLDAGTFTLTRAGSATSLTLPLTVNYTVSGTATSGSDYVPLSGMATFLAGETTTAVVVTPLGDAALEDAETVNLTLATSTTYELGFPATATMMIAGDPESVSVVASDDSASESPVDSGTFTLTRASSVASLALPLTVNYAVSGTATSSEDYTALSGTVTFLAGETTTTVVVTPVADTTAEGAETVTLTLASASYEVVSPASATVTIAADPVQLLAIVPVPVVTVTAHDGFASEGFMDPGRFRFSRTGDTAASLTVTFSVTGSATNGADYQTLPVSVTFAAGSAMVELWVRPLRDSDASEVSEMVILTLTSGATYNVGAPSSATIRITP